jgi:hypothetical protein
MYAHWALVVVWTWMYTTAACILAVLTEQYPSIVKLVD